MVGADDSVTFPLVIVDENGIFSDIGLSSEKAYRKSFEHGALWCVHGETGRVLPYERQPYGKEPAFTNLERREGFVLAVLRRPGEAPVVSSAATSAYDAQTSGRPLPESGDAGPDVLAHLVSTIRERHRDLPEGSYTSYLFNAGGSKIRKKTGEESVEVILSEDTDELVRESADLIYHLLVLLEFEGIPWSRVLAELARREG
jgi:phosphoribosyl-ATP pyrophosphohydrolase